ncbi:spore cortex biosynthesis protein YabQ [Virgibacillus oceani]|uniref:Spore cortex biosynthesis protein YabQ n=1 Tax=Virgibacillus oceani TaxID=1479511 RepID=A0A917HKY9_9BACI|nr:spore cortex biosynthesis protein YabQ [Virgibacillus oceani]GGG82024.1 spore cortex biosynthesis protein YabQ [Virgibacillus oceani]
MTLSVQFMTMIAMVLAGFYLGIIQDTYRRFTRHWKGKVFLTYFIEVLFWLSQTLILFYVLFRVNAGELRFYVFLACLLGFAAYQALAANLYKRLLERVIKIVLVCLRFIKKLVQMIIINPIKFVIQTLITVILFIGHVLVTILLFILKLLYTPLKWVFMTIYRFLPKKIQNFLHKLAGFYSTMKNICIKWLKYFKFKRR